MKLFLGVMIIMLSFVNTTFAQIDSSAQSVALVEKFLSWLEKDTTMTYEEEKFFFGDRSMLSSILLLQAKIMHQSGDWTKTAPQTSVIGKLLASKKKLFLLPGHTGKLVFFEKAKNDNRYFVTIIYYKNINKTDMDAFSSAPISKIILFHIINYNQLQIDLLYSSIDGKSLPFLLGFKTKTIDVKAAGKVKKKTIPFFDENEFKNLMLSD